MHFEILYHFLTVAQQGSISAAARKLHIAQPALSKQMQQLEEALGCTLLIRGSRRLRLTEAGKALCSRTEHLKQFENSLRSEMKEYASGGRRRAIGESDRLALAQIFSRGFTEAYFSGKADSRGLYIGRDKYGSNVVVDFDRRAEDKTNSNILILGNSGQGKSYLMKLVLTNIRESGKSVICLDPEAEYEDICEALGGCYIDFMSGAYIINAAQHGIPEYTALIKAIMMQESNGQGLDPMQASECGFNTRYPHRRNT